MNQRNGAASEAGIAAGSAGRSQQPRFLIDLHPTTPADSFVLFLFCSVRSYLSRIFPRPSRRGTWTAVSCAALLTLTACDDVEIPNVFRNGRPEARICSVPPWHGRAPRNDTDVVNRNLAVCMWEKSRLLAGAPATNEELARGIVGGCWDRVSAWGRVVSPGSSIEDIDRVVDRLQLQSLYWVIEARAGNCKLPRRRAVPKQAPSQTLAAS
jgi:hypothetical protein